MDNGKHQRKPSISEGCFRSGSLKKDVQIWKNKCQLTSSIYRYMFFQIKLKFTNPMDTDIYSKQQPKSRVSNTSVLISVQFSSVSLVKYAVTNACDLSFWWVQFNEFSQISQLCYHKCLFSVKNVIFSQKKVILAKFKSCKDYIFWVKMTFFGRRWPKTSICDSVID